MDLVRREYDRSLVHLFYVSANWASIYHQKALTIGKEIEDSSRPVDSLKANTLSPLSVPVQALAYCRGTLGWKKTLGDGGAGEFDRHEGT